VIQTIQKHQIHESTDPSYLRIPQRIAESGDAYAARAACRGGDPEAPALRHRLPHSRPRQVAHQRFLWSAGVRGGYPVDLRRQETQGSHPGGGFRARLDARLRHSQTVRAVHEKECGAGSEVIPEPARAMHDPQMRVSCKELAA